MIQYLSAYEKEGTDLAIMAMNYDYHHLPLEASYQ